MSINLINGNDTIISQNDSDITVEFSSTRKEQISNIEQNLGNTINIQSNETIVGTYIGKTLYRNILTYEVSGNTTTDISNLNIETLVDYNSICNRYGTNNIDWEKPYYNSSTDYFRSFIRTSTNTIETRITISSGYATYKIVTTLYYTKTTD